MEAKIGLPAFVTFGNPNSVRVFKINVAFTVILKRVAYA
jgi:hypothetical protein